MDSHGNGCVVKPLTRRTRRCVSEVKMHQSVNGRFGKVWRACLFTQEFHRDDAIILRNESHLSQLFNTIITCLDRPLYGLSESVLNFKIHSFLEKLEGFLAFPSSLFLSGEFEGHGRPPTAPVGVPWRRQPLSNTLWIPLNPSLLLDTCILP